MSTIKTKNIQQKVISGTTQPLKIGGIASDFSDAKISIDTSGNLTASNLTATLNGLLTTNGQIKFPATQNPSADANTLDDYEEGTWTPADVFGHVAFTINTQGYYAKIGRIVIATFDFTVATNTDYDYFFITRPFVTSLPGSGIVSFNTYATGVQVSGNLFTLGGAYLQYNQVSGKSFSGTLIYQV